MSNFQLAQLNVGVPLGEPGSPVMAEFMANLDRINALAEASPGFVWRLQTDDGNATALRPFGDSTLVNMSVWEDVGSLSTFVFRSVHVDIMRRRKEWFERMPQAYLALWWVARGHRPTVTEAIERLERLRAFGPTPAAFTFRQAFAAPDAKAPNAPFTFGGDQCPAT